jgi:hypothetical protein
MNAYDKTKVVYKPVPDEDTNPLTQSKAPTVKPKK